MSVKSAVRTPISDVELLPPRSGLREFLRIESGLPTRVGPSGGANKNLCHDDNSPARLKRELYRCGLNLMARRVLGQL